MKENYYKVVISYVGFDEKGRVASLKEEDLIYAANYTEAEVITLELLKNLGSVDDADYSITKTKIDTIILNNDIVQVCDLASGYLIYLTEEGDGAFFEVGYEYEQLTEKGDGKTIKGSMLVVEKNAQDAYQKSLSFLEASMINTGVIKTVKSMKTTGMVVDENKYETIKYISK